MKKTSLLSAAGSFSLGLLGLNGCENNSGVATVADAGVNETVTLRFTYTSNSQPVIDIMNGFGRLVKERTDGSVQIQYFLDGQLDGRRELIELTQSGVVDFIKISTSTLESLSKDYSIFSIPYLFNDGEHFFEVMDNEGMMEPIYQSTKNLGFTGLTYYDFGQCSFHMVDGPTHTPEDLKGKEIRMVQSEMAIKMVELLGGSPVPMGNDEMYTSPRSNLVNGSENNEFVLYTAGHNGVAKYYSYDERTRAPDTIIMNDAIKEQLTAEQEEATEEATKKSTVFEVEAFAKAIEEKKALAQGEHGVQFNDVDNTPFRETVTPLHDTFKSDPTCKDFYQEIQEQGAQL